MPVELTDIRKLKAELRKDLDALDRLEALITMRQKPNGSLNRVLTVPGESPHKQSLNDSVIDVVRNSKRPLRPKEIVQIVADTGYPFGSLRKGMGSVTKVLVRQRGKTVEKQADGTYVARK